MTAPSAARFTRVTSHAIVMPNENVDTDQIIPARFLKVTSKEGLGERLFNDWRFTADGAPRPEFVLNKPESQGAKVIVAGENFGCGSSREHAPWALTDWGIRAIVSTSFADIFKNNSLKNGLVPVVVSAADARALFEALANDPKMELTVDLEAQTLSAACFAAPVAFEVDPFARQCLLSGVDELGYLMRFDERIAAFEQKRTEQ